MDPMLEIARGFLRSEREAGSKVPQVIDDRVAKDTAVANAPYPCTFPEEIYNEICKQIAELTREYTRTTDEQRPHYEIQEFLWDTRDERAQEVLANVFYAAPEIARQVCEIRPELLPEFIHYLADEARRYWEIEKGGAGSNCREHRLEELLKKHGYGIHETFPDTLELALIEDLTFIVELADLLEVALPFSLVLKKELEEIKSSRQVRLRRDPDAEAARMMDDILRIRLRSARLKQTGDPDIIEKENRRLEEHKEKLRKWIALRGTKPCFASGATAEKRAPPISAQKRHTIARSILPRCELRSKS